MGALSIGAHQGEFLVGRSTVRASWRGEIADATCAKAAVTGRRRWWPLAGMRSVGPRRRCDRATSVDRAQYRVQPFTRRADAISLSLTVRDVCHGDQVAARAIVMQHKTQRPVQFEITPAARDAVQAWIKQSELKAEDFPFPSRIHDSPHLETRQDARTLGGWVDELA